MNITSAKPFYEHFPFHEKLLFEFPKIFNNERNNIFRNLRSRGQSPWGILKFTKISYEELLFHLTFLSKFLEVSVEWFVFKKFKHFRIFWKHSQEINFHTICPGFEIFGISGRVESAHYLDNYSPSSRASIFSRNQSVTNHVAWEKPYRNQEKSW